MRGIAEIINSRGVKVSGSDIRDNEVFDRLRKDGIEIFIGHGRQNVEGADAVIYTAAIAADNPERIRAQELAIPMFTRAEALGMLMDLSDEVVCVSGTHGKTTTSSMISHIAVSVNMNPSIVIGGELPAINGAYRAGGSELFIAEACEYCHSFYSFRPDISVILNIEYDHPDCFRNVEEVISSFKVFADNTKRDGVIVVNNDDENSMKAVSETDRRLIRFGMDKNADVYPENLREERQYYSFEIMMNGVCYADIRLKVPGIHNVKNALACACAAASLGISGEDFKRAIETFTGSARRFEWLGEYNGAEIMDDYAHHPSEIEATLRTASKMDFKRIFCVFQPHTYSRTISLLDQFAKALSLASNPILAEIYAARESNNNEVSSSLIAAEISGAKYFNNFEDIEEYLKKEAKQGDLIITMGAGDVYKIARNLLKK